jgi:hypothetical protein
MFLFHACSKKFKIQIFYFYFFAKSCQPISFKLAQTCQESWRGNKKQKNIKVKVNIKIKVNINIKVKVKIKIKVGRDKERINWFNSHERNGERSNNKR